MTIKLPKVTAPKKTTTLKPVAYPVVKTIGQVLDEWVDMDKSAKKVREKIAALQQQLEPLAALEKQIAEFVQTNYPATEAPEEEYTVEGEHSRMRVRPSTQKREVVDKAVIKKAMGAKKYDELAEIKLGDIDKYLTPEEQAKALKISFTKRGFVIEPKHPNA